jgi:hypothetical protein
MYPDRRAGYHIESSKGRLPQFSRLIALDGVVLMRAPRGRMFVSKRLLHRRIGNFFNCNPEQIVIT